MPTAHFHRDYEMYYLISGKRRYIIENEIYDILPGDMILIPEMTTHKVWNSPDTSPSEYHERYLISPRKEDIPEIFLPCFDVHYYHLPDDARETIVTYFKLLEKHSQYKDEYTDYHNHANMINILCTLARLPIQAHQRMPLSRTDSLMQDAALYIKNNCSEQLTLRDLATRYGFNKEYFSTTFKIVTGYGFNEYLNQMRITKAIELLSTTSKSITDISMRCGFNNSNYFTSVFKKITGTTPKKFKK